MAPPRIHVTIAGEVGTARLPKQVNAQLVEAIERLAGEFVSPALRRVQLDFSDTESATSTAVGCLVSQGLTFQNRGVIVAFNGAVGGVDRVLRQIGVYRRFPESRPGRGES